MVFVTPLTHSKLAFSATPTCDSHPWPSPYQPHFVTSPYRLTPVTFPLSPSTPTNDLPTNSHFCLSFHLEILAINSSISRPQNDHFPQNVRSWIPAKSMPTLFSFLFFSFPFFFFFVFIHVWKTVFFYDYSSSLTLTLWWWRCCCCCCCCCCCFPRLQKYFQFFFSVIFSFRKFESQHVIISIEVWRNILSFKVGCTCFPKYANILNFYQGITVFFYVMEKKSAWISERLWTVVY